MMPGYTGYKPQFQNDGHEEEGNRDNRFFIPGYCGYVPSIKSENAFGESYGKTTSQSVAGTIKPGFELEASEKYRSMNQTKFTNQSEQTRQMRPAEVFEPGYDSIHFKGQGVSMAFLNL